MTARDFINFNNSTNPSPAAPAKQKKSKFIRICLVITVLCIVMSVLFILDRGYQEDLAAYAAQVNSLTEATEDNADALAELDALTVPAAPWYHGICNSVGSIGRWISQKVPGLDALMNIQYGEYTVENYEHFFAR